MKKSTLYMFGLITLLVFPLPTIGWFYFYLEQTFSEIFQFEQFKVYPILVGLIIGSVYAYLASFAMRSEVLDRSSINVEKIVRGMNLKLIDCIFISLCAGIGEELLFRTGIQHYLGPIITSVLFVAIHGYLNPFNWRVSLYGFIVLPLILVISYGFDELGLWFAIAVHAAYDFVLFWIISNSEPNEPVSLNASFGGLEDMEEEQPLDPPQELQDS